jgi:hypothetical protein
MNAAIPERRPATEEISGVIERVIFHNEDSGFCVLRVKARGQREETTVVGSLPSVTAGDNKHLRSSASISRRSREAFRVETCVGSA